MGNCLVTKLKAEVNNPNLPYLETMQQFTLDAIALSGNLSMTEAQKRALNHFFYQIGAIANNALWQKIKCLALPVICNDNVAKSLINYVDGTENVNYQSVTISSHGLVCDSTDVGTTKYTGESNGLGQVYVPTIDVNYQDNLGASLLGVRDSSNGGLCIKNFTASAFAFSFQGEGYGVQRSYTYPFKGMAVVSSNTDVTFHVYQGETVETKLFERSEARPSTPISNKAICVGGKMPLGVGVVGHGFTVDEVKSLLIYSKTFVESYLGN